MSRPTSDPRGWVPMVLLVLGLAIAAIYGERTPPPDASMGDAADGERHQIVVTLAIGAAQDVLPLGTGAGRSLQ
jgi:hypothetical protein